METNTKGWIKYFYTDFKLNTCEYATNHVEDLQRILLVPRGLNTWDSVYEVSKVNNPKLFTSGDLINIPAVTQGAKRTLIQMRENEERGVTLVNDRGEGAYYKVKKKPITLIDAFSTQELIIFYIILRSKIGKPPEVYAFLRDQYGAHGRRKGRKINTRSVFYDAVPYYIGKGFFSTDIFTRCSHCKNRFHVSFKTIQSRDNGHHVKHQGIETWNDSKENGAFERSIVYDLEDRSERDLFGQRALFRKKRFQGQMLWMNCLMCNPELDPKNERMRYNSLDEYINEIGDKRASRKSLMISVEPACFSWFKPVFERVLEHDGFRTQVTRIIREYSHGSSFLLDVISTLDERNEEGESNGSA